MLVLTASIAVACADKKAINSFEYWVLIMRYQQPCNSSAIPPIKQVAQVVQPLISLTIPLSMRRAPSQAHRVGWQLQGVRLKFYNSVADILLLEIPGTISDAAEPYRLGYDGSVDAIPRRAIAIHHPHGNVKRISYANARCGMPIEPAVCPFVTYF